METTQERERKQEEDCIILQVKELGQAPACVSFEVQTTSPRILWVLRRHRRYDRNKKEMFLYPTHTSTMKLSQD